MVSDSEVAAARELRSALLTLLLAHSSHPSVTQQQIADAERQLEHAGERYPVRITLSTANSHVAGYNQGAAGVFGKVLAAANETVQKDLWGRLKACCSHPCQHAFIDTTRNASQRYCDSKCASRAAMRAMWKRRQQEP
jgi:predicted RNA-binding Zn ribbon-like protein